MVTKRRLCALLISAVTLGGCEGGDAAPACDAEPVVMTTDDGVEFVRTPDSCFEGLPDWPYTPRYVELDGLRQAYVDEGPGTGPVVLLLHGQPSWSYLYRKMIPPLVEAGFRAIAMDHLGMGRSDKPTEIASYSYLGHADRLERFIEALGLRDITVFVQDWGSLIGLRVTGLHPEWFARIAVGDGALPVVPAGVTVYPPVENPDVVDDTLTSPFADIPAQQVPLYDGCDLLEEPEGGGFGAWMTYSMRAASFRPSEVLEALTWFDLTAAEESAYDAPFPSRIYMGGPRTFPSLVNELPGANAEAWEGLAAFDRPLITIWAANDPADLGRCDTQDDLVCGVTGAADQPHARLAEASHFLQDDQGAEIARRLIAWTRSDDSVAGNYEAMCGLPIAADGTGTLCSTDAECSALTAEHCLSPMGTGGFCTVEGCTAGGCSDIYVCCHDCNAAAADFLPFEGSACVPMMGTMQLTSLAGCTCD